MALPRIDTPTYQTNLPSTGQSVQFRPFLVKEQKIIMMAQESGDEKQIVRALSDLVTACTFNKVDVANAPTFDVEYLFLKIRSKSVGETVDINIVCPDDQVTQVNTKVNLDDIKVQTSGGHNNVVNLTDSIKIVFKYPTLIDLSRVGNTENSEGLFKMINECIHEIHYGDDVYNRVDISDKDIEEFIDQFTGDQFERVTEFFQTMPKLSHKVSVTNPKTNGGPPEFFRLTLSHDSVFNYYKTNFALMQHHKYSLTELENMMPWEREIYMGLLMQWIKEENERIEKERAKQKQQRG
jgi:hypothetical protein